MRPFHRLLSLALLPVVLSLVLGVLARGPALLQGTITSAPIPKGYRITDTFLVVREGSFSLEVSGRGECRITVSMTSVRSPDGTERSLPLPRRECKEAVATYSLPAGLVLDGRVRKVHYEAARRRVLVGDVVGVPKVQWVRLRSGHRIEATTSTARLVIAGGAPARPPDPPARQPDPLDEAMPGPGQTGPP